MSFCPAGVAVIVCARWWWGAAYPPAGPCWLRPPCVRVVVGYLGGALPQVLRLLQRGSDHTGGGAAHGRAVAEAVVGVGMENTSASAL